MIKMTIEDLKECLPKHMQKEANQELVDTINNTASCTRMYLASSVLENNFRSLILP